MKKVLMCLIIATPMVSFAKAEKIDWKACKKEIEEFCTTADSDVAKHECLEEIPAAKSSKACIDFNKKQEAKFKDKEAGHKHNH